MKKNLLVLFTINLMFSYAQDLSIMTYNIKLDYPKGGENSWVKRKPMLIGQLKFYEPDIFGVQEAMPNQMKEIDSALVNYNFVGEGRDGKNLGEYSAIFYDTTKFKILESSTLWLSITPNEISKGWDAAFNRIFTYALFETFKTKTKFWVFNTHFDHVGEVARFESSKLIIKKIKELNNQNHPVVFMGDFNLEPNSESIKLLKGFLKDSKDVSESIPFGPSGTFNGFYFNEPVVKRIDYIFVSNKNLSVKKYAVLSDSKDCKYPSDHLPVFVKIALKN